MDPQLPTSLVSSPTPPRKMTPEASRKKDRPVELKTSGPVPVSQKKSSNLLPMRKSHKEKDDGTSVGDVPQKNHMAKEQENPIKRIVKSEPMTPDSLAVDKDSQPLNNSETAPTSEILQIIRSDLNRFLLEHKTELNSSSAARYSRLKDFIRLIYTENKNNAKQSQIDIINALEPFIEKTLLAHLSSMEEKRIASIDEEHQKMEEKMEEFMSSVTEEFRAIKLALLSMEKIVTEKSVLDSKMYQDISKKFDAVMEQTSKQKNRARSQLYCIFCRMRNHDSDDCGKFKTAVDRRCRAYELKICMSCHESVDHETCPKTPELCKHCTAFGEECNSHHFLFCPKEHPGERSNQDSANNLGKRPRVPSLSEKNTPNPKRMSYGSRDGAGQDQRRSTASSMDPTGNGRRNNNTSN